MLPPDWLHVINAATGVSLELPLGFEPSAPGMLNQRYVRFDDEDEEVIAAVDIQVLGASDATGPRSAVDAMALHGTETARAESEIDGLPVLAATIHYPDGLPRGTVSTSDMTSRFLAADIIVTFAAVVLAGRLVTITFVTASGGDHTWVDRALDSCRFPYAGGDVRAMGPEWSSLTSRDLALSLKVPPEWQPQLDESATLLRLYGPEPGDPAAGGHRPTLSIQSGAPAEGGEGWFEGFRRGIVARMPDTIPGFVKLSEDDFVLSSWVDVTAVTYRRDDPSGLETSQLQAYLWADSYRMYVVNAATARSREDIDLPIFARILHSIRLLPES